MSILNIFKKEDNKKPINLTTKPFVLLVLDGWGVAPASNGNAVTLAKTPNMDSYMANYPHGQLIASGESVGLPANEVGNTEVGHLTLGAGRVILQDLNRINKSIENGTFFDNIAFLKAIAHVKKYNSKLHLVGMTSSGNVHASLKHFYALLDLCKRNNVTDVYLHLFTDGRDSDPKEGLKDITDIQAKLKELKIGKIATISGRYYAMDRDKHWDRVQKAYDAISVGIGVPESDPVVGIQNSYTKGKTDEFIEPVVITENGRPVATVDDNDAFIFFNFRIDRPRQLTMAFTMPDFESIKKFKLGYNPEKSKVDKEEEVGKTFQRKKLAKNVFFVTMTEYHKGLPVTMVAFPAEEVSNALTFILSKMGLSQLHISESEKERFITYYFNGLREGKLPGEDDIIVQSPEVATYDKKPEMSVSKVVENFKNSLYQDKYRFIVMNFANADMVAHSGNLKATIKALEAEDKAIGEVVSLTLSAGGTIIITADHGNAEEMLTYPSGTFFFTTKKGEVNTDHSNNPVPVHIISNSFAGKPVVLPQGALSDVAPTILGIMNIPVPEGMTGHNLLADHNLN